MAGELARADYVSELGNGLRRRWSTAADAEKIKECLATVFRREASAPRNQAVANEVEVMFSPGFPLMGAGDFALMEDTSLPERPLVACLCCWSHRWSLGGIPFAVGRPELVATLLQYRNQGLIRALFEMFHARSAARGELVQAITGIDYYYRQFGYEYALDLGGNRSILAANVPAPKEGEEELYTLRAATVEDAPHMLALYEQERKHSLVWAETTEALWRYYVEMWELPVVQRQVRREVGLATQMYMILDRAGVVRGMVGVVARRRTAKLNVVNWVMADETNWQAALLPLLRALCEVGRQSLSLREDGPAFAELVLRLNRVHPAYDVMDESLRAQAEAPYAWYVRVADVPGFVRHIAPVLEARLAASVLAGYSGELKLELYRMGLRVAIERGKVAVVEPWRGDDYADEGELGCPPLLFNQLLFGYRSLAELKETHPDVWYKDRAAALLIDILFPKRASTVWSMGYT